ncbi:hypothetical protein [Nocardioides caricicola]|uniref:Uncharacterized protein n=1 Tax=Nocardioides caricicola TaxID=634770 RepID=A0ABW0N940_9ACTN
MFQPPELHPNRPGVVAPVRVDPRGRTGPTRAEARGEGWRRSSWGLYVPSWVDDQSVEQRIVEAAAHLPAYGGVTGWAALRWLGGRWFGGTDGRGALLDVTLTTGDLHARSRPGVAICEEKVDPRELQVVDGLRVTSPVRSVCFAMRYAASVREAAAVLDMAAYSDLVSIDELQDYALAHPAWTGIPQCRDAIPYSDENTWSWTEFDMRWIWSVDIGFRRPLCNRPVFDLAGRHIGTPDLLDPVLGVVGEYDGGLHLAGARRAKDIQREADYRAVGLECVTMVAPDRHDPTAFSRRLREAYARARVRAGRSEAPRWTIEPPPWWIPTTSVAARRQLTEDQRARLLRYRIAG